MNAFIQIKRFLDQLFKFGWMNHVRHLSLMKVRDMNQYFRCSVSDLGFSDLFCPTGSIWIAIKRLKDSNTFYGNNYKFENKLD